MYFKDFFYFMSVLFLLLLLVLLINIGKTHRQIMKYVENKVSFPTAMIAIYYSLQQ